MPVHQHHQRRLRNLDHQRRLLNLDGIYRHRQQRLNLDGILPNSTPILLRPNTSTCIMELPHLVMRTTHTFTTRDNTTPICKQPLIMHDMHMDRNLAD